MNIKTKRVNENKIVVLENGKQIEEGNHLELYDKRTKYYELWQRQFPIKINPEIKPIINH